jgi:very-short-patch-repair endonuclease
MSQAEEEFALILRAAKIPFEREHRFHDTRRWRFDFVILPLEAKIAVEIEGGVFTQGRHTRGKGFTEDLLKYNEAVLMGWRVLRFTTAQIHGIALDQLEALINEYGR